MYAPDERPTTAVRAGTIFNRGNGGVSPARAMVASSSKVTKPRVLRMRVLRLASRCLAASVVPTPTGCAGA